MRRSFRVLALTACASLTGTLVGALPAHAATPNYPNRLWFGNTGDIHLSSPTLADVNGDGVKDVVIGGLDGWLHVFSGKANNGTEVAGWPQPVQPLQGTTSPIESSATVADLDNDGAVEIVVGAGSLDVTGSQGGLVVFDRVGNVRWRFRTMDVFNEWTGGGPDGIPEAVQTTPAVADLDGDGFKDIVFGSFDHRIYVKNRNSGNITPPFDQLDTVWSSAAVYDNDRDGRMEFYLAGDASPGGPCGAGGGGVLRAMKVFAGQLQQMWTRCQGQIFQSSPAIGDIDGDGRTDLVIGSGTYAPYAGRPDTQKVFPYHLDNGSDVAGWPVSTNGAVFGSPVIGDVNADGTNEVVVATCAGCSTSNPGKVWVFRGNGSLAWSVNPNTFGGGEMISTPVLVDFDGNGANDIGIGDGAGFWFLRGTDGAQLYVPAAQDGNRAHQNSAAVADIGGGLGWRLVTASRSGGLGMVNAYPLPATPNAAATWPQWRLAATHTGAPVPPPPPPATSGYWLVARDGGVFSFGNAAFYGSTGAIPLNQPIVGMARTPSGNGYWMVAADGGVFAFGDAGFYGSTGAIHLNQPIIGMAPKPDGRGYWLVASDGGVFAFGTAGFYGSTGAIRLNQPIVGVASTPDGRGYWMVARDGGIFSFGTAGFYGSTGAIRLNQPIVGMARTPSGAGYWMVAADGGIFAFGNAPFLGSTGAIRLNQPIVGMTPTTSGGGYWLIASDGGVFGFGNAAFYGSTGGIRLNQPIVGTAASVATA
jgi:hypothetical protein